MNDVEAAPRPGVVMPIGGAEDKIGRMTILREVARLAGGQHGVLAVISTASSLGDEITHAYLQLFSALGVADVVGIRPESRAEAADAAHRRRARPGAPAVFMTGGNQTKLASILLGTPLGAAIRRAHARGALVAGTSAGASICSEHMVSFGSGGSTPKFRVGQVSQGLGLLSGVIVDQHFTQRNRFGRLLALVAANPAQLGMGIDEDTAAVIEPDGLMEVKGRGVVTIVDGSDVITTAYTATGTQPLMMSGIKLHTLPRGAVFDLESRVLVSAPGLPGRGHRAPGGDGRRRAGRHPAAEPAHRGRGRARDHRRAAPAPGGLELTAGPGHPVGDRAPDRASRRAVRARRRRAPRALQDSRAARCRSRAAACPPSRHRP